MILILADSTDPWATLVHREVQCSGGDVSWVQPPQLLDRILINWPVVTGTSVVPRTVVIEGDTIPFADLAECQFIVTPEGAINCLDVSSAPGFWRCLQEVQQPIVCRLVDYLSETGSVSLYDSPDGPDGRSSARERVCETRSQEC